MKAFIRLPALVFALVASSLPLRAAEPLVPGEPIIVPNTKGAYDFIHIDSSKRRLLAAHTANSTLDVFDLETGKLLKSIPTGKAQGVAVDAEGGKYYVSVSAEKIVAVVDAAKLEKINEIKLPDEADDILINPKNHSAYVAHDHGKSVWVIDTKTDKITATIPIPETPECFAYDPATDRIFLNIISDNSVQVIDAKSNTIKEHWTTEPAAKPHGIAFDPKSKRLFSAGNNGKLAIIDTTTGKSVGSVDIAKGTDQIAFDPGNRRIYCGCGGGVVSVVQVAEDGSATLLGDVKTAGTGKTLQVDPKTHTVWTAYGGKDDAHVLKLTAQ